METGYSGFPVCMHTVTWDVAFITVEFERPSNTIPGKLELASVTANDDDLASDS